MSSFSFGRHWLISLSSVHAQLQTLVTLWTVARQAPLFMKFSRQEYWNELSFPTPGDLPHPGMNLGLLHWQVNSLPLNYLGSPSVSRNCSNLNSYHQYISSVQSLSHVLLCNPMNCSTSGFHVFTNSWSLLKLMSIMKLVMPSNHLILWCPLLPLPSIFASNRVFSNESFLHNKWPKYSSFRFVETVSASSSVLPMNIQDWFLLGWFDFLAVQGTLKSLLQHTVQKHQFFGSQLSL